MFDTPDTGFNLYDTTTDALIWDRTWDQLIPNDDTQNIDDCRFRGLGDPLVMFDRAADRCGSLCADYISLLFFQ